MTRTDLLLNRPPSSPDAAAGWGSGGAGDARSESQCGPLRQRPAGSLVPGSAARRRGASSLASWWAGAQRAAFGLRDRRIGGRRFSPPETAAEIARFPCGSDRAPRVNQARRTTAGRTKRGGYSALGGRTNAGARAGRHCGPGGRCCRGGGRRRGEPGDDFDIKVQNWDIEARCST